MSKRLDKVVTCQDKLVSLSYTGIIVASNKTSSTKKQSKKASVVANETVSEPENVQNEALFWGPVTRSNREVTVEEITKKFPFLKWSRILHSATDCCWFLPVCFVCTLVYLFSFSPNDMQQLSTGNVANWCGVLGVLCLANCIVCLDMELGYPCL